MADPQVATDNPPPLPRAAMMPQFAERTGRTVGTFAAIVGLFVTANTLLTTCTRDSIERASSFRAAVGSEERYWSDLHDRYLTIVADGASDMTKRRSQLLSIATLALHPVPDFSEYDTWYESGDRVAAANAQLSSIRQALQSALRDPSSSDEKIANEIGFFLDSGATLRERAPTSEAKGDAPPKITDRAEAATLATVKAQSGVQVQIANVEGEALEPVYGSSILATGPSTGWDVDVFWCEGTRELDVQRFAAATEIGDALATAAQGELAITPKMKLGRIRLRSLPLSAQRLGLFFTKGDGIVADKGLGEREAAQALGAYVSTKTSLPLRQVTSVGALTNWYLSIFICSPHGDQVSNGAQAGAVAQGQH